MLPKTLWLICGAPGTGKTFLAKLIATDLDDCAILSIDDYFTDPMTGEYKWDGSYLQAAHKDCQERVDYHMSQGRSNIIVHNTFTRAWERAPYYELAAKYGYFVQSVHLRNVRPEGTAHNVPADKIAAMSKRHEFTS